MKQQTKSILEKDITKQIDQFDERAERSGWLYLVLVIGFLFVVLAAFMYASNSNPNKNSATIEEMGQKIKVLEQRVETLESQVYEKSE